MTFLTEVTAEDIERLGDVGLTHLLCRLIELECDKHRIAAYYHVNLKITIPDGGEDGRVAWVGGPERTHHLPNRLILFQIKAHISPAELGEEVVDTKNNRIKPRIREVLEAGGAYFVLCGNILEKIGIEKRIAAIQKSLAAHGIEVDDSKICVLDANGARDWANKYVAAAAFVLAKAGRKPPEGTDTWEGISQYPEHSYAYERGDEDRDSAENALKLFLQGEEKVARVYGAAGLGKTRLVIEASRPNSETPKLRGVLFADANYCAEELPAFLKQCRQAGISGCLIVDNCDSDLHDKLQREINHGEAQLKLLTIGNDEAISLQKIPLIELKQVNATVIKKQVASMCPGLPSADIDFITDQLAEGFPQMAVLLAQARLNEVTDIRKIVKADLLSRLLGVDSKTEAQTMRVLTACSIFERLGFDEERSIEYQTIAKFEGINADEFYACLTPFIKRGVINRRGRYIEIRPRPLAWRLAADWWAGCSPEKALKLSGLDLSEDMVNSLCGRVRMLDGVPECVALTKTLCAPSGPFGQAELLNSEMGSKLFRAFCEVNPSACTLAIHQAFGSWSTDNLRVHVGPGRRQLVWALERLCFWKDEFDIASRVLLKFAVSENETWSNNATGILTGFFRVLLSGTQSLPAQRIALAHEALESPDPAKQKIGLACLGKALESRHFSRISGSEQQGGRPPMLDWRPKTWQEIFDYWDLAVSELIAATQKTPIAEAATSELSSQLRNLFLNGRLETLDRALEALLHQAETCIPVVMDALRTIERYDLEKAPAEAASFISNWQNKFTPTSPQDQLILLVAQAPWDHQERENGELADVSAEKAIQLACELARHPKWVIRKIDDLLFGEQRQTYIFAKQLGTDTDNPCQIALVALRRLATRGNEEWNSSFIAGLVEGTCLRTDERKISIEPFLEMLSAEPRFVSVLIPAIIAAGLSSSRLSMLDDALASGNLAPLHVRWLSSGRATKNIETRALGDFCLRCAEKGTAFAWAALDVLFMHCHGERDKWEIASQALEKILLMPVLFAEDYSPNTMDWHHFEVISEKLLNINASGFGVQLADRIAQLNELPSSRFRMFESLGKIAFKLLHDNPTLYWKILAQPLLAPDWHVRNAMAQTLGDRLGDKSGDSAAIKQVPVGILLAWCAENVEIGPTVLIENAPLFDAATDTEFSNLVKCLLMSYGTTTSLLSSLGANMFSFGWVGTPIPYYQRLLTAVESINNEVYPLAVRAWASGRILELQRLIAKQKVEDEEGF